MLDFLRLPIARIVLAAALLTGGLSSAQNDDFNDGNFTSSPAWSGDTGSYSVIATTPLPNGSATTDGSYLASNPSAGNTTLMTPSTESAEWKFSLGSNSVNPTLNNHFGVILISNIAVTGSINATSWSGYYIRVASQTDPDYIELWKKTGAGNGTKIGQWTNAGTFSTAGLAAGLNLRITKSGGTFTLYHSTGFTYASTPTTSAGTVVDTGSESAVINTNSYFGVFSIFGDPASTRRVFIDNIVLGNSLPSPYGTLAGTLNEATLDTAEFTVTLNNDTYAATLTPAKFTLNNAPAGVTVASVVRTSATVATVKLAYDGTDFDTTITNFSVNVAADQLTSNAVLTTGNLAITAVTETITSSPTSITGLTYTEGAGPSAAASFTISASSLKPGGGVITINGTSTHDVSVTDANTGFGATATLAYTGTGTLAANNVWVRLKAGLTQASYPATIVVSGGKATLSITANATVTAVAPGNNLCANAETLTVNSTTATPGTMVGATYTAITGVTAKNDVWYKFDATCSGPYLISVGGFTGNIDMSLTTACPTTSSTVATGVSTSANPETISTSLTAGTTYYVRVYATSTTAETSTFTIQVANAFVPTVTMAAATGITNNGAAVTATATVTACSGAVTSYGIQYSTSSTFATGNMTTAGENLSGGAFSVALSGLVPATTYYYRAYAENATGLIYSPARNFTTLTNAVTLPYTQNFEGATPEFSYTNPTVNKWIVGDATNNGGTKSLYVSNGTAYTYTVTTTTDTYASVRVDLTSQTAATLFFDWKSAGEIATSGTVYDYGEVYINTGGSDILISSSKEFAGTTAFQTRTIDLTPYVGGIRTLKFRWYNDSTDGLTGTGIPFAIDNIMVKAGKPATVTTAAVAGLGYNKATLGGNVTDAGGSTVTEHGVVYATTTNPTIITGTKAVTGTGTGAFSGEVAGLLDNTVYYVRAFATNATGTAYGAQITFTTNKIDAPVATAATPLITSQTGFTANWNAVPSASGYRLDVSTLSGFGTESTTSAVEGFESGMPTGYSTSNFNLTTGTWAFTSIGRSTSNGNFRTGAAAAQMQATTGALLSPAFNKISSISFYARNGAQSPSTLVVEKIVNGVTTQVGSNVTVAANQPFALITVAFNETNPGVQFRIRNTTSPVVYIDDITINYTQLVPNFVAGYNNRTVTGTSETVTGLTAGTTYYYRVRAVGANSTSDNSNTISAVAATPNIWDNGAWSLGTPPSAAQAAVIRDNYNTGTNGPLSVSVLSVEEGDLVVAQQTVLTVANNIAVNGGSMTVQSNGLVMQSGTTNRNTGNVTVRRNSAELFRQDYTMWSSPVAGQNVFNFSAGTLLPRFYTYNTATDHYESMFASAADAQGVSFAAGKGYLIRMPNGSDVPGYIAGTAPMVFTGNFTGVLNNGDYPVVLSTAGAGYNAIGNPYPSLIDADAFITRNAINSQRIEGTLYFWRKKNGVEGDAYATYTYLGGAAGTGQAGTSNDPNVTTPIVTELPNGRIQAGQGFIVKARAAGSQPLFVNSVRKADFVQNDQFFRTSANAAPAEKHRLWLNMQNSEGLVYQSLVGYMDGATNELDNAIDGRKFDEAADGFYSVVADAKLTIQGRALPFSGSDVVSMGYKSAVAGNHKITLSSTDGLFAEGQDIFLRDNVLGVTHNIKESAYTFATEAGTFENRFEIVYAQALGTDNPVMNTNSIVVYKQGSAININAGTIEMTGVTVYDIQGRQLYSKTGINATEAVISDLQSQQQVLIIQITTAKNGKVSRKIVF